MADVAEISGGPVRLRAGTLYAALDRLRCDYAEEMTGPADTKTGSRWVRPSFRTPRQRHAVANEI
jgi:hypothetical protein